MLTITGLVASRVVAFAVQTNSVREVADKWGVEARMVFLTQGLPGAIAELGMPLMSPCFAEGVVVTPEMLSALDGAMRRGEFHDRYNTLGSWTGVFGPTVLTWSLVPDGLVIPSAGYAGETDAPSTLFANMDSSFFSRATWIGAVQASFDRWAQLTGVRFRRVTDGQHEWDDGAPYFAAAGPNRGDIRIGMKPITANVVAYAYYPQTGDITLNSQYVPSFAVQSNSYRYLRNTLQHEIGHSIGLLHACPQNGTKVMEPNINNNFDGVQHDDVRAGQSMYGDVYENNSSASTAADLGVLSAGSNFNFGATVNPPVNNISTMGISSDADSDYYKVSVLSPTLLSANATPLGSTYASGWQNGDGTCSAGTSFNSAQIQKLQFELRRNDLSLIGTSSGTAATTLTRRLIAAGTYFIRVYSIVPHGFDNASQLYTLTGNATRAAATATSDATYRIDISWASALSGASYELLRAPEDSLESEITLGVKTDTLFSDTNVVAGVRYQYRVLGLQPGSVAVEYERAVGIAAAGRCPADFNADSSVDDDDFLIFVGSYSELVVPPANPRCDMTADLMVDDQDFVVFVAAYDALVCP